MAHWLNYISKRAGVKWRNGYQRNVNVTRLLYLHFHILEVINPENWPANSQYLSPVDLSACHCEVFYNGSFIVRSSEMLIT